MKRFFYTEEMLDFIRNNCETKSNSALADDMNFLFGNHFDKDKIQSAMKRYGIKRKSSKAFDLYYAEKVRRRVPQEVEDYIREHHVGIPQKKMIEVIKEKFGIEYSHSYMKFHYSKMGYCSGLTGHFSADDPRVKKNQFQKGKHYSSKTEFKKGHKPHNSVPVGTIVKQTDGWWAKKIAEPNVWKHMHRLIWEEAHGPIPKGMVIMFLDGDKDNYQLDNLYMISRGENSILNRKKYRTNNAAATKLGVATVRLENRIKELKK